MMASASRLSITTGMLNVREEAAMKRVCGAFSHCSLPLTNAARKTFGRLDGAWLLHPKREPVAQLADLFGIGAAAQKNARQVAEAGFAFHLVLKHPVVGDPKRNVFLAGTGHGNSG